MSGAYSIYRFFIQDHNGSFNEEMYRGDGGRRGEKKVRREGRRSSENYLELLKREREMVMQFMCNGYPFQMKNSQFEKRNSRRRFNSVSCDSPNDLL